MRTLFVTFGTRPEAIKMAPVVLELAKRENFRVVTCLTGQHRQMLDQVIEAFGLRADHDLDVMQRTQSLTHITTAVLSGLEPLLADESPDLVLVHGDTTTTFAASLAAFYQQIPVAHVEAGLRTDTLYNPYPEEANRRLTDRLAEVLFAPTAAAERALLAEGAAPASIHVTGNTVIDALLSTAAGAAPPFEKTVAAALSRGGPTILVTVHRRESWGGPMQAIARAIKSVCARRPDVVFVFPIHLNPVVRETFRSILGNEPGVVFIDPLPYRQFVHLMKACGLVITDSGGIQEEAPALGKPVLVMRNTTERPEGIEAGTARLVGTDTGLIADTIMLLLENEAEYRRMATASSPYGDGRAAVRIADYLEFFFGFRAGRPVAFNT
jgi:UDP-N-acetylglucosamine 2-epimerase (non-hydrolysing)